MSLQKLNREELQRVVDLINGFVVQYPRIGAELLRHEVPTDVAEIASCSRLKHGAMGDVVGKENHMELGFHSHGPQLHPACVRLEHMLAALGDFPFCQVMIKWEQGVPHLEVR